MEIFPCGFGEVNQSLTVDAYEGVRVSKREVRKESRSESSKKVKKSNS